MLYYNNRVERLNINELCIVMDFDNTITSEDSISSYGVFQNKKIMGENFCKECLELDSRYIEVEKDYKISEKIKKILMKEWAEKSIELLIKYNISQDIVEKAIDTGKIKLRTGLKEFFVFMKNHNIPVIIISAGIGNVIEAFLKKEGILFENITIIGNFFGFSKRKVHLKNKMIYTSNKNEIKMKKKVEDTIIAKECIVLIGDTIEDISIVNNKIYLGKKIVKIGFLNYNSCDNLLKYNSKFDIVLTKGGTFKDITDNLLT